MSEESVDGDVPKRAVAALMQHRRRALLIECLREYDEPVSLPDLADEVAVREHGTELTAVDAEAVKEIYLSLYHSHIPKLATVGLVEYDQEGDLVTTPPEIDLDQLVADGRTSD